MTLKFNKILTAIFAAIFAVSVALSIYLLMPKSTAFADDTFSHTAGDGHTGWTELNTTLVNSTNSKSAGEIVGSTEEGETTNYYLNGNVTLTDYNITITGNVVLCLNGYVLTGNSDGSVITIGDGETAASLTLCDCKEGEAENTVTVYTDTNGNTAEETFNGGVITGGNAANGGGVNVSSNASFVMEGGTIAGNSANTAGGGVYVGGATFTMNGGEISNNSADSGGGVRVYGGTFTMNDGTISNNSATNGGGVRHYNGTFTINGGTISNNSATNGGGVYVHGGAFTMNDGTISGNVASGEGGGVHINSNGTFTMNGGTISGDSASTGGGVINFGTFVMEGGTISNNSATNGGGVYVYLGTFYMYDGTISGNSASNGGGGVYYVSGSRSFTMNGGTIADNTANWSGGVHVEGTFTMNDGTISGNTARSSDGGGVNINGNGTFTMNDGTISGNTASNEGGGVWIGENVAFEMNGGTIYNNTANVGGGVYVYGGTFTMNGGEISYNTASVYGGGGVNMYYGSPTFTMNGGTIKDNITANNGDGSGVRVYHGTFNMYGGYLDGSIYKVSGSITIYGGYLSSNYGYIADGYTAVDIFELGGADFDEDYKEGFPYAVYKSGSSLAGDIVTVIKDITFLCLENFVIDADYIQGELQINVNYYGVLFTDVNDESIDDLLIEAGSYTVKATFTAAMAEIDGVKTYYVNDTATFTLTISGHTSQTVAGKAATCTESGLTDGSECSVCDKTFVGQEVIPATGHSYDEGICTICRIVSSDVAAHTHDGVTFTHGVTSAGGTLTGGSNEAEMVYYYLLDDVTLTNNITISGYVTLCLNGHMLTGNGNGSVITVSSGANFTLCDCNTTTEHNYYVNSSGLYVFDNGGDDWDIAYAEAGTENQGTVYGGVITGGTGYLRIVSGEFYSYLGGGVYVDGRTATFTMNGGTISGNTATGGNTSDSGGGGVYVYGGTFVMNGGVIEGNYGDGGGGVNADGTFTMNSGEISGNTAKYWGGGVCVDSGDSSTVAVTMFIMKGGTIKDNMASYGGGVYVYWGTFYMYGGTISGNTANNDGDGVYAYGTYSSRATFTMTGGYLDGSIERNNSSYTTISITGGALSQEAYSSVYDEDNEIDYIADGSTTINNTGDSTWAYVVVPAGYTSSTTEPTCTEEGYTAYTYTIDGREYTIKVNVVSANGHSFTEYVSDGNATATEDGTKTAACDNGCGTTNTITDEGSATGGSGTSDTGTGNTDDGGDTGTTDEEESGGLSGGAIAGIVIGCVVVAGVAVGLVIFLRRRKNA